MRTKALFTLTLFALILIAGCGINNNQSSTVSDVNPYNPPISCLGQYQCAGEAWYRGAVTSRGKFWNQAQCLADLQAQVATACDGRPAQVSAIQYTNHNSSGGTSPVAECGRFDPNYDYYATVVNTTAARGGYGAAFSASRSESISKATKACRRSNSGCTDAFTIKNGCVTLLIDGLGGRVFGSGCSSVNAQSAARAKCSYCREVVTYCAWK